MLPTGYEMTGKQIISQGGILSGLVRVISHVSPPCLLEPQREGYVMLSGGRDRGVGGKEGTGEALAPFASLVAIARTVAKAGRKGGKCLLFWAFVLRQRGMCAGHARRCCADGVGRIPGAELADHLRLHDEACLCLRWVRPPLFRPCVCKRKSGSEFEGFWAQSGNV